MSRTNNKRNSNDNVSCDKTKKQKNTDTSYEVNMVPNIDNSWVSASRTRNYMLKDPLLDWLTMYGAKKGFIPDTLIKNEVQKSLDFGKFIMNKGVEFEKYIVTLLKNKHNVHFHEVDGRYDAPQKKIHRQIKDTLSLLKSGARIIFQGLVFNPQDKTWGYPDLIVRSDYLNSLCETPIISEEKAKKGCKLSPDWHYRIIDIKFTTLKLRVDEKLLLNSGSILPYKAQTCIYNNAIGYMQGLIPRKAYLLGRGWNTTKKTVMNPFDKLGTVDFVECDKTINEDSKEAVNWVRRLREEGDNWSVLPYPSIKELYPNMCNDSNNEWGIAKSNISKTLEEITRIWNCGVDDREKCLEKGVTKWTDPKFNSKLMEKGGKVIPPMIDKFLEVNKGNEKYSIEKCDDNINWKKNDNPSFFIDFETVSNINNIRSSDDDGNIFMIGCVGEEGDFNSFVSSRLSCKDEKKVIEDFLKFIDDKSEGKGCRLYHYSFAEPTQFKKAVLKYNITIPNTLRIEWIDLLNVVKNRKFIVKGALDFSLKSVVNAMSENGMIDKSYKDSEISGGMDAMISAFICDGIAIEKGINMFDTDLMKNVVKYNKLDCDVLRNLRDVLNDIEWK